MHQTPVMVVDGRWWQAAWVWSIPQSTVVYKTYDCTHTFRGCWCHLQQCKQLSKLHCLFAWVIL